MDSRESHTFLLTGCGTVVKTTMQTASKGYLAGNTYGSNHFFVVGQKIRNGRWGTWIHKDTLTKKGAPTGHVWLVLDVTISNFGLTGKSIDSQHQWSLTASGHHYAPTATKKAPFFKGSLKSGGHWTGEVAFLVPAGAKRMHVTFAPARAESLLIRFRLA